MGRRAARRRLPPRPSPRPPRRLTTGEAVWSVGYQASTYTGYSIDQPYALMQWNGRAWTEWRLPQQAHVLYKVDAASARDVWTVGVRRLGESYAGHFDGSTWTAHAPWPAPAGTSGLLDVAATGGGRAVFVGHDGGRPLVVAGGSGQFGRGAVPGTEWLNGVLRAVSRTADAGVFAAGERYVADAPYPEPMIAQRVGGVWRVAPLPSIPSARLTTSRGPRRSGGAEPCRPPGSASPP
ncbi:hypothetical protein [Micromonospora sp. WMMD1274]|uniref:hypothetical protein n=1 Tax=Micromonospora sp. WMMD1274 TaxID=3404116 RepID=UPI003B94701C